MKASIIIPAYKAKDRLYNNLISLNCQDYPFTDFEVIVIDNGSTDDTAEMLANFSANYPLINIPLEQNIGIARGRNLGILKASGDIIIFHDSDMIATKEFVRKHIEAHEGEDKESTVVCGLCWKRIYSFYYRYFELNDDHIQPFQKQYPSLAKSFKKDHNRLITEDQIKNGDFINYSFDLDNTMITSLKNMLQRYGKDLKGYQFPWRFFLTNNASISRRTLLEVGLFDEKNTNWGFEDLDLAIRLHKLGYPFMIRHDIVNVHQEHPVNYSLHSFKESIRYMLEKYNDIKYLDMLLILLTITTSFIPPVKTIFDDHDLNETMKDIDAMMASGKYSGLLNHFRKLVQTICKKHLELIKNDSQKRVNSKRVLEKWQNLESELIKKTKKKYFSRAFITLILEIE